MKRHKPTYTHYHWVDVLKHFVANKTNRILIIVLGLGTILFFTLVKNAFIIVFLIFLAWITKSYQKYMHNIHLGFDFTMMVCILTAFAYGPIIGSFVGILTLFVNTLWTGRFTASVFFAFILLAIISFVVQPLKGLGITTVGITLSVLYDLVLFGSYMSFFGGKIHKASIFWITHSLFNIWAFIAIAPKILKFM